MFILLLLSGQPSWQGATITHQSTAHDRDTALHQAGAAKTVLPEMAPLQVMVEWHKTTSAVIQQNLKQSWRW